MNDDMLKDEGRKAYACTNSEEIAWWGATWGGPPDSVTTRRSQQWWAVLRNNIPPIRNTRHLVNMRPMMVG